MLKIFNNVSAQFLVESFKEMDSYREHTYTFWLYIYGVRNDPCCPQEIIFQKANILVGIVKGDSPAIYVTDPGLTLRYKFGEQGAVGPGIGPAVRLKSLT